MDNNEQGLQQPDSDAVHSSRRRRTPSRYYTSIRELTKVLSAFILAPCQIFKKGEELVTDRRRGRTQLERASRSRWQHLLHLAREDSQNAAIGDHPQTAQANPKNEESLEHSQHLASRKEAERGSEEELPP